jgi:hypothetical protein
MKKQLIITALALATSLSAFGQGYVLFSSTAAQGLWYNPGAGTNPGTSRGDGGIMVGFLWAASGTPLVGSAGIAVSNSSVVPDWTKILTDPLFHFAQNAGALVTVGVNNAGVLKGGFSYLAGATFPLQGSTAGSTIQALAVAWSSAFATPQAAAAGGSFLGYSPLLQYATAPDGSSSAPSFAAAGMPAFGVNPVPEPATFALAGLGAAAMLIFRRRK